MYEIPRREFIMKGSAALTAVALLHGLGLTPIQAVRAKS